MLTLCHVVAIKLRLRCCCDSHKKTKYFTASLTVTMIPALKPYASGSGLCSKITLMNRVYFCNYMVYMNNLGIIIKVTLVRFLKRCKH